MNVPGKRANDVLLAYSHNSRFSLATIEQRYKDKSGRTFVKRYQRGKLLGKVKIEELQPPVLCFLKHLPCARREALLIAMNSQASTPIASTRVRHSAADPEENWAPTNFLHELLVHSFEVLRLSGKVVPKSKLKRKNAKMKVEIVLLSCRL